MNNAEIFFRDAVMLANAEDVRLEARAQRRPRVNSNITRSSASAL